MVFFIYFGIKEASTCPCASRSADSSCYFIGAFILSFTARLLIWDTAVSVLFTMAFEFVLKVSLNRVFIIFSFHISRIEINK